VRRKTPFKKVLVANRGEIAVRVIRACRELGIPTVLVHSEADRGSLATALADETVCIGPGPSDRSYLNIANVLSAAQISGADAIHPGYGFLSENHYFVSATQDLGLTFIGPPASAIQDFGDKVSARKLMREAGVPVIPGTDAPVSTVDEALGVARDLGLPVMLKARAGGGGRGLRAIRDIDELARQFPLAQREAQSAFGDGALYLEKYIERGRHVEVQVAADAYGHAIHVGERECSLQRRHQKIVEEAPSPALDPERRERLGQAAVAGLLAAGYQNVGTVEFLVDQAGAFYFMEVNTRLQVEHPVTEMTTGLDLVKLQILLAAGERLPYRQADVQLRGHAIECRVAAEDPTRGFAPVAGQLHAVILPGGPWVRVDTHLVPGASVPPYYDSLLAKIIVWGRDRPEALARMRRALAETQLEGLPTNLPYLATLLADPRVEAAAIDVEFIARHLRELDHRPPAPPGDGRPPARRPRPAPGGPARPASRRPPAPPETPPAGRTGRRRPRSRPAPPAG
jgi:acetyl-CoA carboxylase biotin carboxylase subunit